MSAAIVAMNAGMARRGLAWRGRNSFQKGFGPVLEHRAVGEITQPTKG